MWIQQTIVGSHFPATIRFTITNLQVFQSFAQKCSKLLSRNLYISAAFFHIRGLKTSIASMDPIKKSFHE